MKKSKLALAVAALAVTGFGASTVTATTEPPATEAEGTEAMGTEAAGDGGSGYVTLEDECAQYGGLQAPDGFRVNLVTDLGKVDDGTFNQFAYEGMVGANECFGIEDTSYIETASEADYASNIATSLEESPNVLVTVGFLLTTDTAAAAAEHPEVTFIGIDQFLTEYPANMAGVLFAEEES
jgi:basic membrane lipoprotein Med (substrate-binding protein (PBP1-ABC) superfamily)